MPFGFLSLLVIMCAFAANLSAADSATQKPFSFAVLGHVRGNDDGVLQPVLEPLLAKIGKRKPDMVFLTGDMIWGGLGKKEQRADVISRDWDRLDAALAKLKVPVYRTPGNHDLHDPITRDIYFARYGKLPYSISYRGSRFLLLNSSYVPEGTEAPRPKQTDHGRQAYLRGKQLDPAQINFIRSEIADSQKYDHLFIFMHHVLWWHDEEAAWWREVHPLIAGGKVRAVFAGDVGPRKFSHMKRDGIDYLQSSIADIQMEFQRRHWRHRMIAQQFDNYLEVTVNGPQVVIDVGIIGELSSGHFTPQSWREMLRAEAPQEKPLLTRAQDALGELAENPWRLVGFASVVLIAFLAGIAVTIIWHRRTAYK
jgi:hypothetical protein